MLADKESMAQRPRFYFPGALYRLISRGNQKRGIFLGG